MKAAFTISTSIVLLVAGCSEKAQETPSGDQVVGTQSEEVPPAGNALQIIKPYFDSGTWIFDDPSKNLEREPFVAGVPEILNQLVVDIPDAKEGFRLTFSSRPFPGHELVAHRAEPSDGGYWYEIEGTGKKGWLCPAMFKYFDEAPEVIYAQADPVTE